MLKVSETTGIVIGANKEAATMALKLTAGNVLNDRVVALVKPRLPLFARPYAETEMGKAVLCNAVAAALIHFMPRNGKAIAAAECMMDSAMVGFVNSFNIEDMVSDLLEGVDIPNLGISTQTAE